MDISFEIGQRVIAILPLSFVRNPKTFSHNFRHGRISGIYIGECECCPTGFFIKYAIDFGEAQKFRKELWYNPEEIYKPT